MKSTGIALFALVATGVSAADPQVFRSATHAVALDVSVFDGDRAVRWLRASDFEVYDNGAAQVVSTADTNMLPIDLTLVFDTSVSIRDADLTKYLNAMRRVTAALRPDDRCEILTFSSRIAEAAPPQYPPVAIDLRRTTSDGTSFFDAVSLAMITVPAADTRRITIVLSDGQDNISFFDETAMTATARRTDSVVYTVLPASEAESEGSPFVDRLERLSRLTGGRLVRARRDSEIGERMIEALEEFRVSYVLRYTLRGVPAPGWHKLAVRVRGSESYTVRAREGYFGK